MNCHASKKEGDQCPGSLVDSYHNFILRQIKRSRIEQRKQNKYKPCVAKKSEGTCRHSLRLSRGGSRGRTRVRKRIPRHYFSLEIRSSGRPCMCEPQNGSGRWHKREPGRSSGKMRKRGPRHSAWGRMTKWACQVLIHASEITSSGARRCSRRGRACRGMPSSAGAGKLIYSSGGCIRLGALA